MKMKLAGAAVLALVVLGSSGCYGRFNEPGGGRRMEPGTNECVLQSWPTRDCNPWTPINP